MSAIISPPQGFGGGSTEVPDNSITDDKIASQVSTKITGFPPLTTTFIRSSTVGITASTTQTQGEGALTTDINQISVVANTNDTVTLPSAIIASVITVINDGVNSLRIFPASGDDLEDGVDVAMNLASGSTIIFVGVSSGNWEIE